MDIQLEKVTFNFSIDSLYFYIILSRWRDYKVLEGGIELPFPEYIPA